MNSIAENKELFMQLYKQFIHREGADKLLAYLENSDFFDAPASTKFHSNEPGGLCKHSLNVFEALYKSAHSGIVKLNCSDETLALVSLLHDICKVGLYAKTTRNVRDEAGKWVKQPYFALSDDRLGFGHGDESVYVISAFMRLTREEAMAIRFHMGLASEDYAERQNVGLAFKRFPLALLLYLSDLTATYEMERTKEVLCQC